MSTPINYFYAAKHVFFGRTALLLFREKHTFELICTQHMYVQPSDAIGVMVGLKISRLGGKIGQSSPLAPCLPACLAALPPLFSADRPRCTHLICGQADIMQNASVCILAKETALAGFMAFSTLLKGAGRKSKPESSHGHASHLILDQLCRSRKEKRGAQTILQLSAAVCVPV